ncbi:MAG: phytanoyl-CoA dioxygenase family protein [Burkholderiales bacterium]|nr:phytanoyl-CoA dioxygenase family protein [Burkholderiales bacterium]
MNKQPLRPITAADRADFERDGVVCLRGMFDFEWLERMRRAVDHAMDAEHPLARRREVTKALGGKTGRSHINTFVWAWNDDFRDWVLNSPCAEIAARIMGVDEVRFFYDQVFVKEPNTAERTDWHHDLPFWPMRGNDIVSVWVALTDVDSTNSQLEYIAGSHKWGKFYAAAIPDKDPRFKSELEPCPDFSTRRDDPTLRFLRWDMQAGDCLVHHPLTVHGSDGNFSLQRRRVAISTRYMGPDARWDPRPAVMAITGDPQLEPGAYPADDRVFPVAWRSSAARA